MWTSRSEDRLREWKEFRRHIGTLPFNKAVEETVKLWSYAPFVNHYLDHCTPADWPGPWDLLAENVYDDMAKALGMVYTLYLSDHGPKHKFSVAIGQAGSSLADYHLALVDDGKYILNFQFNEVISNLQLDKDFAYIKVYTDRDLNLHKY
jgi:hypothetical protein